jgi:hypothetical protein
VQLQLPALAGQQLERVAAAAFDKALLLQVQLEEERGGQRDKLLPCVLHRVALWCFALRCVLAGDGT